MDKPPCRLPSPPTAISKPPLVSGTSSTRCFSPLKLCSPNHALMNGVRAARHSSTSSSYSNQSGIELTASAIMDGKPRCGKSRCSSCIIRDSVLLFTASFKGAARFLRTPLGLQSLRGGVFRFKGALHAVVFAKRRRQESTARGTHRGSRLRKPGPGARAQSARQRLRRRGGSSQGRQLAEGQERRAPCDGTQRGHQRRKIGGHAGARHDPKGVVRRTEGGLREGL